MSFRLSHRSSICTVVGLLGVIALFPFSHLFGADSPSVAYLKSKPVSPWTIMALSSAGESVNFDSLKSVSGTKAIDLETPILALTSDGKDPRTFGSTDLVQALRGFYDGTQLGEVGIINDDIFGLLALVASGEPKDDAVLVGSTAFIRTHQNTDGGFSFAVDGTSDTNTTAAAIMALRAVGLEKEDSAITKAIAYLKASQNDDGGFPYDPNSSFGTESDASSDAWVVMALTSLGETLSSWQKGGITPLAHLETLKQENGMYLYQVGGAEDSFTPVTTAYALMAVTGKTFPIRIIAPSEVGVSFSVQIEGKEGLLCDADGTGDTAIDALKRAGTVCGIAYHIQSSSLGDYVDEIAGETASGSSGWIYTVNGAVPSVGAGAYHLKVGDAVRWYFGSYDGTPASSAVRTEIPLAVSIPKQTNSDASGGNNGSGNGTDETSTVSMIVDVGAGGTTGPSVAFGTPARGDVVSKSVTLRNSGSVATTLSTAVSGDAVFRRYLRLNQKGWREYTVTLSGETSTTTDMSLAIPVDYDGSGTKIGALIFFATPIVQ
ncbi:MAG: hypothetical protein COV91_06145 [Candidatus Taylorbacteria bacterium CG11_big_fil_rev_8_21_14_0_20_46_11]|uniref:DUF4430 domain-containing protein n=1 Tax=Candidatus Taylorbacteria bacterium CG11_big_fil_rev_8_21_14_0_20_46_11 TaxID=1975025 RepID=A0A2H0K9U4_9BACT|nr:MAG: hypothetical protein COV91_06145 [Candidatus Taylorbacteria bacterium CG11_big_fil_rev_8_21_14_0_20_46_11]